MATERRSIVTTRAPDEVWNAVRDVGALHTRLVRGFVRDTRLEAGARVVTFANGTVAREPIVTVDDEARRLVWGAETSRLTHYSSAVQVLAEGAGSRVVWTSDFLPDAAAAFVGPMMEAGIQAMQRTLDGPE